jgi:membrane protease subunit HflC
MKKLITTAVVVAVLAVVFFLLGPFYVLDEGQQAVVTRFGAIVSTADTAGLKFKLPVVDNVVKYPKKILAWDGDSQRIPTRENQFIWVDTTARWRVTDPAKFYEAYEQLSQKTSSSRR